MVTTFYPPLNFGGDGIYVYQLANELASLGHEVEIIHCQDSFAISGKSPKPLPPNHANVSVHTLRSPWKFMSPLATQQTGRMVFKRRAIERVMERGDFDVIHYHNISLVGGLGVLGAGQAIKLYTLHDYWLICPTHVLFKNRRVACKRPSCIACQLRHARPPQIWRYFANMESALRQVDCFLAGSQYALTMHAERGLVLPSEMLPLFSQLPESDVAQNDFSDFAEDYFLFVGRLEKLKGLQDVLPYFQANPEFTLLIAGSGNYRKKLVAMAQPFENIRFLGQQSRSDLRLLYKNAIATIVPSLAFEISPQVLLESWSVKTPVISRGIGALQEIVQQCGGGLCFSSSEEMHGQLNAVGHDKALRDQLGEAGYDSYVREWSPGAHIGRYLSIIDRIRHLKHERKQAQYSHLPRD